MAQKRHMITVDGNEGVTSVAYRSSEVIAIYPITPSSTMGEVADERAAAGLLNVFGEVPGITEMQSEAGAIGACHGALQSGALVTTFTASQGLLLMIPNMFKIAGELTPFCMHVSARTVATHALSIFGDQSDVMSCRQTGFAMLASNSVQEAHDMACIGHAATLQARIPFLHFFDGFRTSSEVGKIEELTDDDLRHMMPDELVAAHRRRALSPDHPVLRGASQNPDTFFQMQESRNGFYDACPGIVQETMDKFASMTGRRYNLFDYHGDPDADRIVILMGSGAEAVHETVDYMNAQGEKVGVLKVRLFRPFSLDHFISALPASVRSIAVLDRTKECGALGEPLYQDVVTALAQARARGQRAAAADPVVIGGRYGLSSKEFNPAMVKAVFDELRKDDPKRTFTVGIVDDVSHLSLDVDESFDIEPDSVKRAVFWGLGADGTVGANKNSIKIIAENTDNYGQGYFVYDSKKSGGYTVSHVRFGKDLIHSTYLIKKSDFVACHQFVLLEKYDVLETAREGATFLLNAPFPTDQVWDKLPRSVQQEIIDKKVKVYTIDALKVAQEAGMGRRINTVMQTCYFAISGVLPRDEAIEQIKKSIEKTYRLKGADVVQKNFEAVDATLANLHEIEVPQTATANHDMPPIVPDHAPDMVKKVTALMLSDKGNLLPVSAFPLDGTWPTATAQYEKRNLASEIPVWIPELCIQCNKCAMVCPHAAIRVKTFEPEQVEDAPPTFQHMKYKGKEFGPDALYSVQVAPEDCTGCKLCVRVCPGKDKKDPDRLSLEMAPQLPLREQEKKNFEFFLELPEVDRTLLKSNVKMTQFARPLIEFSGACVGCGETPYLKLMTQMYGDRAMIANATGCSSIFGGNLPTTPYCKDEDGRGPAWCNSLFEDNAEFGLGYRLAVDQHRGLGIQMLKRLSPQVGESLVEEIVANAFKHEEVEIAAQRKRIEVLKERLKTIGGPDAMHLFEVADYLVHKSVWIVGGDGWAYDIGYGGLDHVLATGKELNVLVMDTEVYSNTGGQQSKATSIGAAAKFAVAGKSQPKKDLGLMAMAYGNVYVASVAFGARDAQTVRAFEEAESYRGTSLIIAYSNCIAHGYDMADALDQHTRAVTSGYWPLYRYDPRRLGTGEAPLILDSKAPSTPLRDYMEFETRFRSVKIQDPDRFSMLVDSAEKDIRRRYALYEQLAGFKLDPIDGGDQAKAAE
ncbi:MAG: pyruvate:ferredoxin (flavodoxin) oxidoreductase [Rhodospirillales bacterium]|nr:pyruvate:ferredoxin (flavodoxin) oxidoreductase [Rhodospirillales bacterium]MCW8970971.1 pyruvate:ferredoxin (flavodoxin) oxidoreductase [Rhodospirillales bacterium]MCW9002639.1 pyruvate:ferredoxin (flavodoxin) oxidoreductase [Rhodospirillales bacterium]